MVKENWVSRTALHACQVNSMYRVNNSLMHQQWEWWTLIMWSRHAVSDRSVTHLTSSPQVFIDAPHPASGPIPDDVAPYFEAPYYEWVTAEETPVGVEFDLKKVRHLNVLSNIFLFPPLHLQAAVSINSTACLHTSPNPAIKATQINKGLKC